MFKKASFVFALLVAVAAICIGLVSHFAPHQFLKIPKIGFIFWAMTGNHVPPYFSSDAWKPEEMSTWIRDNDVVIATAAKSGTTWMLYCSHQIRTKGSESHPFVDVSLSTPWPDFIQVPGSSWAEQKLLMASTIVPGRNKTLGEFWDHVDYPFRVFKSHFTPLETGGVLPVKQFPKVKFVAMARNGLDVVASMIPFFDAHTDFFRSKWGGFPPASTGNITTDTESRLNELLPGGLLGDLYFTYVKQWWPLRREPNVLLLHYSDAKKDLPGTVRKLANFYGVDLTSEELDIVSEKCSLPYMKRRGDEFLYAVPLNPEFVGKKIMLPGSLTRNGNIGDGKTALSESQQARFMKAVEEQFADDKMRKWALEGGVME